ncbi:1,2-phenylacetyl-CoA epoxidase subunit PaaC [Chitinophaga nivalis]|uniref:Phenylacetate-CoA oxygenase subunit PaaC n=1 Tax=Chitinophaga nivalis TaxID=2991709 RepID=A0ABT3IW49_9BACT|nr:1,2-phenylacetyl-CoA epoxidase subunit PaaC [Chitinophaga nivalis]MCW3462380.1 phenylacetate-CoA oxygenase subunit PaaC [Chitinophaga nivalis]MCW3487929.1 phenylacetate-CoA oxygenase subunit PaaC [Chitinophaga nivalis]
MTNHAALTDLIIKMADDELILGHRNSEWTGLGPVMEEDIAFSSMAQDKIGHAWALYRTLHEDLGGEDPDRFAFMRPEKAFKCAHLTEMPNGEYDFSLMRHFLFDHAETVRYESLQESSFEPFRLLSKKVKGELKYHTLHANAWIMQLSTAGEESYIRMQAALNHSIALAAGVFEPSAEHEATLIADKVYPGEAVLYQRWLDRIYPVLVKASLNMPDISAITPVYGGRQGFHTEYLQPLLTEMGEVFNLDTEARW